MRGQKAWTPRVDCDSMGLLLEGAFGHVPGVRGGGTSETWGLTWDLLSGSGFNVLSVYEGE